MSEVFGMLTAGGPSPVPLTGVRVTGEVLGRGARVKLAQRFHNREAQAIEAVYRFPLPETAAVCGFSAVVGGRRISGSVEEREKAFEAYDDALARGHGGFLLDQERPNIFTLSVGSLPPNAEAVVEIEYVALLDQRGREVRFSLPTTISPRYLPADAPDEDGIPAGERIHPSYAASVPYGLSIEIALRDASGIESVESPSHPISVSMADGESSGTASTLVRFASETVAMDRDFVLTLVQRGKHPGRAWRHSDARGTWLQLDLAPDEESTSARETRPREVIFVLDCSGSMGGDSIAQAKRALEVCLKALEPGCSFNIVRFGSTFQSLFPEPRAYGERSLGEALGWLAAIDADLGGTEVLAPLAAVYATPAAPGVARSVVLLTDGEVGNEAEVRSLVGSSSAATRFFGVGIGAGPNGHLLRGLARTGGGTAAFIFPGERIEPRVLAIFRQAIGAWVSGLTIDWGAAMDGRMSTGQAPASPVLLLGEPMSVFARLGGAAVPRAVAVSAEVDGTPVRWELAVADTGSQRIPLPTLWARARIRDLEESQAGGGRGSRQRRQKSEAWKQEVVSLAREFGLSSSLTSWIAVEEYEEKDRQTGELVLRKVPTLVTVGWHGIGSVRGQRLGAGAAVPQVALRAASPTFTEASFPRPLQRESAFLRPPTARGRMAEPTEPPADTAATDLLMALLSLQRVDGGFDLDDAVLVRLGIRAADVAAAARHLPLDPTTALRVLHTALVLEVLTTRFAEVRASWFAAVRKSRAWLAQASGGWGPVVDGKTVDAWATAAVTAAGPCPGAGILDGAGPGCDAGEEPPGTPGERGGSRGTPGT